MDTITAMFAIDAVAGTLALVSISGVIRGHFAVRTMRSQRDDAIAAKEREEIEGAHFRHWAEVARVNLVASQTELAHLRELADDALATIEGPQAKVADEGAAANRWAAKYSVANAVLRKIERENREAAERRSSRMRTIGIIGNQSPKRRKHAAA